MMPNQDLPPTRQLPTVENALHNLVPDASWSVKYISDNADEYKIEWMDKKKKQPPKSAIKNEVKRLEEDWRNTEYIRQRVKEYPQIGDQLDALFHAGVFPEKMHKKILDVKKKYPK